MLACGLWLASSLVAWGLARGGVVLVAGAVRLRRPGPRAGRGSGGSPGQRGGLLLALGGGLQPGLAWPPVVHHLAYPLLSVLGGVDVEPERGLYGVVA